MICLIALVVFGTLGIFSATHRKIALEAFDCVFRRLTLRKCDSGLDKRIKSQIIGKLMNKNPKVAKIVFKNFEIISWIFIILFTVSTIYTGIGAYNYYLYGNCNGPNEEGFCVFDPLGENTKTTDISTGNVCNVEENLGPKKISLENINLDSFPKLDRNAKNDVVFVGCYACPYTRKSYLTIRKFAEEKNVNFIFAHYPAKESTYHISNILNCVNSLDSEKFMEFNDKLFTSENISFKNEEEILNVVEEIGLDKEAVRQCSLSEETKNLTKLQVSELKKTGIYGTPTVFVNGEGIVGPKPDWVYRRHLK